MKHPSGLDSTYLHVETPETPMHVASLKLFETTGCVWPRPCRLGACAYRADR